MVSSFYNFLIVEDDDNIRTFLIEFIRLLSHSALGAEDGEQALEILERHEIDGVITDIKMPRMDGLTLMSSIHQYYPQVPVAVMSGTLSHEKIITIIKQGAVDFLPKPFQAHHIQVLIEKIIKAREKLLEFDNLKNTLREEKPKAAFSRLKPEKLQEIFRVFAKVESLSIFYEKKELLKANLSWM